MRSPRRLADALGAVVSEAGPKTLLADVQAVWSRVCGEAIAAEARPVAERDGVVTVACRSAIWAQELDLMQSEITARIEAEIGRERLTGLRFTADAARHDHV